MLMKRFSLHLSPQQIISPHPFMDVVKEGCWIPPSLRPRTSSELFLFSSCIFFPSPNHASQPSCASCCSPDTRLLQLHSACTLLFTTVALDCFLLSLVHTSTSSSSTCSRCTLQISVVCTHHSPETPARPHLSACPSTLRTLCLILRKTCFICWLTHEFRKRQNMDEGQPTFLPCLAHISY